MRTRLGLVLTAVSLAALAVFGLLHALARAAEASALASFTVDTLLDDVDAANDGFCATADGRCTLRAAIQEANAATDDTTIVLPAGVYSLTLAGASEDAAATGDLDITGSQVVTISGAGAGQTTISATGLGDRHFEVLAGAALWLDGVTLSGGDGSASTYGGALYSAGALTVTHSTFLSNTALAAGALLNDVGASLTISDSTFLSNTTTGPIFGLADGGAVQNYGQASIATSLFSGNVASPTVALGGGLSNEFNAHLTVTGTVFSGNSALFGGGLSNRGTLTLTHSLVSANTAVDGGGVCNCDLPSNARMSIANSTVMSNTALGPSNGGGGVGNLGTLTVLNSTVAGNTAPFGGGFRSSGPLTVTNSTISGNTATDTGNGGGGFWNANVLALTASTVVSNSTGLGSGGGVRNFFTTTVASSIVAGNTAATGTNPDIDLGFGSGVYFSQGYNLIGVATGIAGFTVDDQVGTVAAPIDALLGPLQDNGGDTSTHAPQPASPAVNGANCASVPATDQRGVSRPQGALCDIGAVELILVRLIYLPVVRR